MITTLIICNDNNHRTVGNYVNDDEHDNNGNCNSTYNSNVKVADNMV